MARARSDGRILLVLGVATFVLFAAFLKYRAADSMVDFKMLYYGARALLQHSDPYNQRTFFSLLTRQPGQSAFIGRHESMALSINLPTTYLMVVPLAILPFWLASAIWSLLTAGSLIAAACLIWRVGAAHAPVLSGVLAGFALINGAVVVGNGNSAGIIVGLCVMAAWCFITERAVWLGVFFFAVSLVVKPQDAGLLWLFFLLAGAASRKRALQVLAAAVLIALPAAIWVSRSAPQWVPELHSNLVEISAQGGNCDPGPKGLTTTTGTMEVITDLQTVVSVFRDSPWFYNLVSFLVCGALLVIWSAATLRSGYSPAVAWLAMAAIAPLTLLVSYHRAYDARLLLLVVPSCAMLWAKGGSTGKTALAVSATALIFSGEIPLAFFNPWIKLTLARVPGAIGQLGMDLLLRMAALTLLAASLFYLCAYWRGHKMAHRADAWKTKGIEPAEAEPR